MTLPNPSENPPDAPRPKRTTENLPHDTRAAGADDTEEIQEYASPACYLAEVGDWWGENPNRRESGGPSTRLATEPTDQAGPGSRRRSGPDHQKGPLDARA
jgi:hypothetical protein